MQMIVLITFALTLSLGGEQGPRVPGAGWALLAGAVPAYLLGTVAVAWGLTRLGLRRLARGGGAYAAAVRFHRRWQILGHLWLAAGMTALVMCGLSDCIRALPGMAVTPLADEALAMAVFLAALLLWWRIGYPFDRAVRGHVEQELMLAGLPVRAGWSARQHMDFNLRHHFLFVTIPIALIVLILDLLTLVGPRVLSPPVWVWGQPIVAIAAIACVFFFSPLLLIHVWRTRPLPDGDLRRRLERLCGQIGLQYRQVRIWDTGGVVVNAGVMGLHRAVRYILVTDGLMENMNDQQIVAVFGHEAGHVKHHHIAYFLVFMVGANLTCVGTILGLHMVTPLSELAQGLVVVGLVLVIFWLGFGWLSRRFERQSDLFGAWCVGMEAAGGEGGGTSVGALGVGAAAFVAALENVARLNGVPRDARSWRHGSIAGRVAFLVDWVSMGQSRTTFDRGVRRLKWALLALAPLAGAVLVAIWAASLRAAS